MGDFEKGTRVMYLQQEKITGTTAAQAGKYHWTPPGDCFGAMG